MASINVINIDVLNPQSTFLTGFDFEITFECVAPVTDDLEWKVIYVGSASSPDHDQELDSVLVGPVPLGTSKFLLSTPPPDVRRIPEDDILGATVVMVTCSYKSNEFVRVGYWVANTYTETLPEGTDPPKPVPLPNVARQVLRDTPRVTRFPIDWT